MRTTWLFAMIVTIVLAHTAGATPPEPSGPHPRMVLDAELRAAWKAQIDAGGPVTGAIKLCDEARTTTEHDDSQYQGSEWARTLQACLVAWAATDKLEHQATALRFFRALLDDEQKIGDHKGGDESGKHDSGYAIRNRAPYAAIAYDWLHDAPGMTPELRQHARERWAVWLNWYAEKGYRKRDAATNYQAGYLIAATTVAIAQGGEAAEQGGPALWKLVADELWGKDVAGVLATGGLLDGGDWPEGWQYGPLSVAEYALAARIAKQSGIPVEGVGAWLAGLLRRYIYALTPSDGLWAGGDTEDERAYIGPNALGLVAVALGDASAEDKSYAKGELARLKLSDNYALLYDALAAVGPKPVFVPRDKWPTWYRTTATSALFARTRWDDRAIWFVAECSRTLDVDHRHPDAGNFALSRGRDDVVVDPSPYGSLSTLTSNAPTVVSAQLPGPYQPSQGFWAEKTRWIWTTQTRAGVVAARCDYADAYKFQDRKSDIAAAVRDFVLLPSSDGTDAALVVIDRASTGDAARAMHLRFRIPASLALDNTTATATIGGTRLAIHGDTEPTLVPSGDKDCFKPGIERGKCDAARIPVTDYRVLVPGPEPRAVHVIAATAKSADASTKLSGAGWSGLHLTVPRDAVVIWPATPATGELTYRAPKGAAVSHVILDGPGRDGTAGVTAKPDGDGCAITVTAGGSFSSNPTIVTIDQACVVAADPETANASSALGTKPPAMHGSTANRRSGCCDAGSASSAPLALVVLVLVLRARRRARVMAL